MRLFGWMRKKDRHTDQEADKAVAEDASLISKEVPLAAPEETLEPTLVDPEIPPVQDKVEVVAVEDVAPPQAHEEATKPQSAPPKPTSAETQAPDERAGWSWGRRLRQGLAKTSSRLGSGLSGFFGGGGRIDDDTLEELEDLLIMSDLGVEPAAKITAELRRRRFGQQASESQFKAALAEIIAESLDPVAQALSIDSEQRPHVMLVSGVNGAGKTTTIGKLAHQFQAQGAKVMLAAADTYRAAAVGQLQVWGERAGVPVITGAEKGDPAAVAYKALEQAKRDGIDVLIVDTAGRLHNKADLMAELAKIVRVIKKLDASAPHDTLLVLDATTGQNAINQVKTFKELIDVTGLIVTKLDGSARGGVIVGLANSFGLPIHAVGVGEGLTDLAPFDPQAFAAALVGADSGA